MANSGKQIKTLTFMPGAGFSLDFVDKAMAVRITPKGDVLLDEGEGPDRLDGVCIPGRSVQSFQVDHVAEGVELRFWYQAIDGRDWHVIGITDDATSATAWAERVNQLYVAQRGTIHESPFEKFSNSIVVHDIFTTRTNIILPGDYIYSSMPNPPHIAPGDYEYRGNVFPKTGLPAWQDYYMKCCMDQVIERTSDKGPYTIRVRKPPGHDYLWIADKVKYPSARSKVRVMQPLELMFDREPRHEKIGVVPHSDVDHFAVVFLKGQQVQEALSLGSEELAAPTFDTWIRVISQTRIANEKVLVCAPQEQSVYYSLKDAVFENLLDDEQLDPRGTVAEQARWLVDHAQRGFIACDKGVALQIVFYMRQNRLPGGKDAELAYVPYEKTVSAGFCYRADDTEWAGICAESLSRCMKTQNAEVAQSLAEYAELGKRIGVRFKLVGTEAN